MSVESKLDALTAATAQIAANQAANQTAILTAIQAIPGVDTTAVTAALAQIEAGVTQVNTTLGTEAAAGA